MKKDTLAVVLAHGGAQDTFDRHLKYWTDLPADLLIISPQDWPIRVPHGTQTAELQTGRRAHNGPESIKRFRKILTTMYGLGYHHYAFFEYDAICLQPAIMPKPDFSMVGNVFYDTSPGRRFEGTVFIHPPIFWPGDIMDHLMRVIGRYSDEQEHGFWDRWLGLICEKEGIPLTNAMDVGTGFAHNTIEPNHLPSAVEAARKGAYLFHGVKTPEVLAAIQAAYVPKTRVVMP